MDHGDYYWGMEIYIHISIYIYSDYYRDPFPDSLLSTRQFRHASHISLPPSPSLALSLSLSLSLSLLSLFLSLSLSLSLSLVPSLALSLSRLCALSLSRSRTLSRRQIDR